MTNRFHLHPNSTVDFICALLDEIVVLERTGSVKGSFRYALAKERHTALWTPMLAP